MDDFATGYVMGQDSNNNCNGGFMDGGWGGFIWILLIFAILSGGWGFGGGFGGFGGMGGAGFQGMATRADINEGFALQGITSGIQGIQNGLCDGFHNMTIGMQNGFNTVQQSFCQLGHQISDCCCQTQNAIQGVKYDMAVGNSNIQNAIATAARDITDNANANTRSIMDFLVQDKISTLTAENQALKFQASQASQNAFITANQEAQTAELIRRLGRDCPVPAYVVPNPNCCYGNPLGVGYNGNAYGGCGCGC